MQLKYDICSKEEEEEAVNELETTLSSQSQTPSILPSSITLSEVLQTKDDKKSVIISSKADHNVNSHLRNTFNIQTLVLTLEHNIHYIINSDTAILVIASKFLNHEIRINQLRHDISILKHSYDYLILIIEDIENLSNQYNQMSNIQYKKEKFLYLTILTTNLKILYSHNKKQTARFINDLISLSTIKLPHYKYLQLIKTYETPIQFIMNIYQVNIIHALYLFISAKFLLKNINNISYDVLDQIFHHNIYHIQNYQQINQ